jgi:hypothetical protein
MVGIGAGPKIAAAVVAVVVVVARAPMQLAMHSFHLLGLLEAAGLQFQAQGLDTAMP